MEVLAKIEWLRDGGVCVVFPVADGFYPAPSRICLSASLRRVFLPRPFMPLPFTGNQDNASPLTNNTKQQTEQKP
jgi:hypothetical protein